MEQQNLSGIYSPGAWDRVAELEDGEPEIGVHFMKLVAMIAVKHLFIIPFQTE